MKVSDKEKEFFEKLCAISEKDKKTVKDVLISLLVIMTKADYMGDNEIVIPFICSLRFDYNDVLTSKGMLTKVGLVAEPMQALINEFSAISEGETTPSEKYYKKRIFNSVKSTLEIIDSDYTFQKEFEEECDEDEDEDDLCL